MHSIVGKKTRWTTLTLRQRRVILSDQSQKEEGFDESNYFTYDPPALTNHDWLRNQWAGIFPDGERHL